LDKDGKIKNVFQTGDDFSVSVYFKKNKHVDRLNFGLAIFDQENKYIFGINTIIDKIDTEKYMKNSFYQVDYKNVPLKTNSYYVKSGIFGENDMVIYDFLHTSKMFKFISSCQNQGMLELNYNWK